MGKDWLHWVKSSSTKREMKEASSSTSTGCMCAVFQIFDLHHHFQLPKLSQQDLSSSHFDTPFQEETTTSKGLEAPRNSLEVLDQPDAMNVASMPLPMKEQESLNFPVGIHVKTGHDKVSSPRVSASKSRIEDISSDYSSSSPGTKTPTIVARLMGLDLLPECTSPSFSNPLNHQRKDTNILQSRANRSFFDDDIGVGARSLPETPRVSLSRRSDVEYHRRSLQINKENTTANSRRRRLLSEQLNEENISPGHYAKQIVKQAKERVGLTDITNTNKNKREYSRRDENLVLLKPNKKKSELLSRFDEESKKSCSSRLRLMEINKKKPVLTNSSNKSPRLISGPSSEYRQGIVKSESIVTLRDSTKLGREKFSSSRLKKLPPQATDHAIRNKKKEEPFFRSTATIKSSFEVKKSSKTPLSTEILNLSGPATKLHQKKVEMQSHVPDALSSKKSTQLSSNPHHSYNPDNKIFTTIPDNTNGCTTTFPYTAAADYINYIQRILKHAAISDSVTPLTIHQWHTRSHPLDPSIFHFLELFHPNGTTFLSHRCNRKLIFELVDELLSKMTRPHHKYPLIDELCDKILNFPEAKCRVLEDIDALIDTDLGDRYRFVEDEVEGLVCEIEGEIVEGLVRETVEMFGVRTRSEEQRHRLTGGT